MAARNIFWLTVYLGQVRLIIKRHFRERCCKETVRCFLHNLPIPRLEMVSRSVTVLASNIACGSLSVKGSKSLGEKRNRNTNACGVAKKVSVWLLLLPLLSYVWYFKVCHSDDSRTCFQESWLLNNILKNILLWRIVIDLDCQVAA